MNVTKRRETETLRGKRYIAYARCATPEGAGRRLQQQVRLIRQFGDSLDMRCVDEVRLANVSGWLPAMRADLRQLLARKRKRDDYDVLIMEDFARLTRIGLEVGLEIETEFSNCGVRIVYLTEMTAADGTASDVGAQGARGDGRRNAS